VNVTIIGGELSGHVKAPSSKSITHRELIISALSKGCSVIKYPLISNDTEATASVLSNLGINIKKSKESWTVEGGYLSAPKDILDCNESGTTLRLMTGVCSLVNGCCKLTGKPSLKTRPMKPLLDALNGLGTKVESLDGYPPIKIHGGKLFGGIVKIPGNISSQFISSLLIVAPLAESRIEISVTTQLESKPYVAITLETMKHHGVNVEVSNDMRNFYIPIQRYTVQNSTIEGDWSSAAVLLAAGALSGKVNVTNLNKKSSQADLQIIKILKRMGASIEINDSSVTSIASSLKGIKKDLSDYPDLFPIVSALCSVASGESILTGLERLSYKESDRVFSMMKGLRSMGADIKRSMNAIRINGKQLKGANINPFNDHRIAMSFGVLGLVAKGKTIINEADCVSKSYPSFWDDLESIGAKTRRKENE
jgi:3-phosphoshikimate 1-carboxyvinyltransferase